jgi:hypothetical protein
VSRQFSLPFISFYFPFAPKELISLQLLILAAFLVIFLSESFVFSFNRRKFDSTPAGAGLNPTSLLCARHADKTILLCSIAVLEMGKKWRRNIYLGATGEKRVRPEKSFAARFPVRHLTLSAFRIIYGGCHYLIKSGTWP